MSPLVENSKIGKPSLGGPSMGGPSETGRVTPFDFS